MIKKLLSLFGLALLVSGSAAAQGIDTLNSSTAPAAAMRPQSAASASSAPAAAAATAPPFRPAVLQPGMVPAKPTIPPASTNAVRPGAAVQAVDYGANLQSDVFGANLFAGTFAREGGARFNPDYVISVGDRIQVRLWGAFDFDQPLEVDPRGNIFIPHAGPVPVLGVRNQDLQNLVEAAVARTFRNNVYSYASLAAAQPVRVFVGGFVNRPGLYSGTSMDSLLHYLDEAGGIDPDRGSFLDVQVKRGAQVRTRVNLYDFLLRGTMPLIQFADGDVIFVAPRHSTVRVSGLAANAKRFEFEGTGRTVADIVNLAKPDPSATHVRVVRNTGPMKNIEYYALADASRVPLQNGDELEFTADKKPGSITVRVEGEHLSPQEYVLPYGTRLGELLQHIQYSERSDRESLQLFRQSVKERQKQMLATSLKSLETAALTARSGTSDEARLRKDEADLILQWVERAKSIEPSGQVVISQAQTQGDLLLENGDVLRVPTRDGLVLVSGEVLFPNAVAFDRRLGLEDYVKRAGGYTQNADSARIVVARRDGSFVQPADRGFMQTADAGDLQVRPGDEILVLPKIDVKSRQIWKDMTQILYQIAVSAKVVLGL
jgi:protein involved in polysaccharide export with SLBB domain